MDLPTGVWLAALWQMRTHSWASAMASLSQVYCTTIKFNISAHCKYRRRQRRTLTYISISYFLSSPWPATQICNCLKIKCRIHIWIIMFNSCLFPVVSAEVEMTAYGLLTYTLLGDVASALPVVKWLSQQRNSLGGFSSTQVALFVWLLLVLGQAPEAGLFHNLIK